MWLFLHTDLLPSSLPPVLKEHQCQEQTCCSRESYNSSKMKMWAHITWWVNLQAVSHHLGISSTMNSPVYILLMFPTLKYMSIKCSRKWQWGGGGEQGRQRDKERERDAVGEQVAVNLNLNDLTGGQWAKLPSICRAEGGGGGWGERVVQLRSIVAGQLCFHWSTETRGRKTERGIVCSVSPLPTAEWSVRESSQVERHHTHITR